MLEQHWTDPVLKKSEKVYGAPYLAPCWEPIIYLPAFNVPSREFPGSLEVKDLALYSLRFHLHKAQEPTQLIPGT